MMQTKVEQAGGQGLSTSDVIPIIISNSEGPFIRFTTNQRTLSIIQCTAPGLSEPALTASVKVNKIKQVERRCIETKPDVGRRCVYTQSLLHLTALVGLDRGVIMAELLLVEQVVEGRGVVIAPVNPDV